MAPFSVALAATLDELPRRGGVGPTLVLTDDLRSAVDSWRERPYPVPDTGESPLRPRDLIGEDEEVAPLLTADGLTWVAVGDQLQGGDK